MKNVTRLPLASVEQAPRLGGRTIRREELTADQIAVMFDLLGTFFAGVTRPTFDRDLSEKSHAILLEDQDGCLRGFSTLLVYKTPVLDTDATIVYSGDTIVHRDWWGSPALPVTWLRAVRALTPSANPVYWLLLTSGFRTYRFLSVFWREFYPRYDAQGVRLKPDTTARSDVASGFSRTNGPALVDALARERFGDRYDPSRGIVRFDRPQVLVPELLDVSSGRISDPHVAFFLERNPGYTRGDELVCVTDLGDHNLTAAGRRIARHLRD
jgi:hypothetical protein